MQENCIICTAPSKTFNIAGLGLSNIFIPNKELRAAFQKELDCTGLDIINLVSMEACKAAYSHGEDWLEQLLIYIKQNSDYVQNFLAENLPQITMNFSSQRLWHNGFHCQHQYQQSKFFQL